MGKNFSTNNSSGKRKESDFYETPYSLTKLLLQSESIKGNVLEPAKGKGAIEKILTESGLEVKAYDKERDFFTETNHYDWIITNPPYSLALGFIKKAKLHSNNIAFLLPLSYLHGKKRYEEVYTDNKFPLTSVSVFTRYPMLGEALRDDGKHNTGMMVYAWFIWKKDYKGSPVIKWLDNNEYILKKNDN